MAVAAHVGIVDPDHHLLSLRGPATVRRTAKPGTCSYTGPVIRSLRLHRSMLRLALLATLLMLLAPLASRVLQDQDAHAARAAQPAAGHAGHAMERPDAQHAHHAHAGHATPAPAPDSMPKVPADPHALHGEACEYCVLSARLLPWLAAALVLVPALHWRVVPAGAPSPLRLVARRWPAHAVRGPPKRFEVR